MAKIKRGIFTLQGTVHDLTFVNSVAYGAHVRAPRGTYRKATCNTSLTQNYKRTVLLNGIAKGVFDVLKEAGKGCRDSFLWQRMLSRLRKCRSDDEYLMKQLEGLELNPKYPLQQLFAKPLKAEVVFQKKKIVVRLEPDAHPRFSKKADAYRYEIGIIYCDSTKRHYAHEFVVSDMISMKDSLPTLSFSFIETEATYYVVCLRIQARKENETVESYWGNRMCVVSVVSPDKPEEQA